MLIGIFFLQIYLIFDYFFRLMSIQPIKLFYQRTFRFEGLWFWISPNSYVLERSFTLCRLRFFGFGLCFDSFALYFWSTRIHPKSPAHFDSDSASSFQGARPCSSPNYRYHTKPFTSQLTCWHPQHYYFTASSSSICASEPILVLTICW